MSISIEQAKIIASAIRPQIRAYIEMNREKYENFLKTEKDNGKEIKNV